MKKKKKNEQKSYLHCEWEHRQALNAEMLTLNYGTPIENGNRTNIDANGKSNQWRTLCEENEQRT